jgi:hypothetical protein
MRHRERPPDLLLSGDNSCGEKNELLDSRIKHLFDAISSRVKIVFGTYRAHHHSQWMMATGGDNVKSNEGEINFLAGPTPRSNVAKDIVVSLASIPEAHETHTAEMSSTPAEHPLEIGKCNDLILVRYKDIRQPFWRHSMSKMSEYFMSGGVKGKLMCLQAETANKTLAPIETPDLSRKCPHAPQGIVETGRDESKILGETPRTRPSILWQKLERGGMLWNMVQSEGIPKYG